MTWMSLVREDRRIQQAPFEFLFTPGEFNSRDAFAELHRRMRRTIFYMARSSGANAREAVSATASVFLEFAPEFPGTPPELGLRRLARTAKLVIGDEAFEPFYFYAQVPVSYMRDATERELLRRFYETGGTLTEAQLAEIFGFSSEAEAERVLKNAVRSFLAVLQDLPKEELRLMTDGQFPV